MTDNLRKNLCYWDTHYKNISLGSNWVGSNYFNVFRRDPLR